MATRRRPRLTPAAAPTDPFVRPGVIGPKQGNFDIGAFRGLSRTLQDFAAWEQRQERIDQRNAERTGPEAAAALQQRANDPAVKKQISFLYTDDEATPENIKSLKDLGVKDADNPYLVLEMREFLGRQLVRERGYEAHMKDPEFVANYTNKLALKDESGAKELIEAHRGSWMQEHGANVSQIQMNAFAAEMTAVDARLDKMFDDDRIRKHGEMTKLQLASQSFEVAQAAQRAVESGDDGELQAQMSGMVDWYKQKLEKTQDPAALKLSMMGSLRSAAERLTAESGSSEAGLKYLAAARDKFEDGTTAGKFLDAEASVISIARQRKEKSNDNIQKALRVFRSRTFAEVTSDTNLTEFYSPKGRAAEIANELAETFKVSPDEITSSMRDLLSSDLSLRQRAVDRDEKLVESLKRSAYLSDDPATVLARVDTAVQAGAITVEDAEEIRGIGQKVEASGRLSPESKRAQDVELKGIFDILGDVVPTQEALSARTSLTQLFKKVYGENLTDPTQIGPAINKARAAVLASDQYKELQAARTELTPEFWIDPKQRDGLIASLVQNEQNRLRDELAQEPDNPGGVRAASLERTLAIQNEADRVIEEVVQSDEFRNAPNKVRRSKMLRSAIHRAATTIERKATTGEVATSPQARTKTQMNRMASLDRHDILEVSLEIPSFTGGNSEESWLSKTSYQTANHAVRNYLESWSQGGGGDWKQIHQARGAMDNLLVAASASLKGARPDPRLATTQDRMLRDIHDPTNALRLLKGQVLVRGLTAQQLRTGEFHGTRLERILGEDWVEDFPLGRIALVGSTEELDTMVEHHQGGPAGPLAELMLLLHFDPSDQEQVDQFVSYQRNLLVRRGADKSFTQRDPGFSTGFSSTRSTTVKASQVLKKLRDPLKISSQDTSWAKALKEELNR